MSDALPSKYCGARSKSTGQPCRKPAGAGTNHLGQGRCRYHGGGSIVSHGRYSRIKREELRGLIEQHAADPDPTNILPELAAGRALFEDFINRYNEIVEALLAWYGSSNGSDGGNARPRQILDIADAHRMLNDITKMAERFERIRLMDAIPRAEVARIFRAFVAVVEQHNTEPDPERRLELMRNDWVRIPGPPEKR